MWLSLAWERPQFEPQHHKKEERKEGKQGGREGERERGKEGMFYKAKENINRILKETNIVIASIAHPGWPPFYFVCMLHHKQKVPSQSHHNAKRSTSDSISTDACVQPPITILCWFYFLK